MSYHLIDVDNVHYSTLKYIDHYDNIKKIYLIEKKTNKNPRMKIFSDDLDRIMNYSFENKIERVKHGFKTKNATDKILMFYLGKVMNFEGGENEKFFIHTNDKDFDDLIEFLTMRGHFVEKISNIKEKEENDQKANKSHLFWNKYSNDMICFCNNIKYNEFTINSRVKKVYLSKFLPKIKDKINNLCKNDDLFINEDNDYSFIYNRNRILSILSKVKNIRSVKFDFIYLD